MEPEFPPPEDSPEIQGQVELSIIIVNYNTRDLLKQCLDSVWVASRGLSTQVIVSDNGSSDGSQKMCRQEFPWITLLENGRNLGFGAANNIARSISRGRFILFLNSDTIVKEGALDRSVAFLERNPQTGAVGCRLNQLDGVVQFSVGPFTSLSFSVLARVSGKYLKFRKPEFYEVDCLSVDYICGAFMMVNAEVLEKTGWFDEQFFMFAEEMDLCWRINESGFRVSFFAGAEVVHLGGMSNQGSNRSELWRTISKLRFVRKHHSGFYFECFRLLSLCLVGIRRLSGKIDGEFFGDLVRGHWTLDFGVKNEGSSE